MQTTTLTNKIQRICFSIILILSLVSSFTSNAQYYVKHYIAPAPWQYFSDANVLVISTNSTTAASVQITKSDGTAIATVSAIKGTPVVYRFIGNPLSFSVNPLNTVVNAAGIIVTSTIPVAVNLRNIASDAYPNVNDTNIKGNASLTSFGDAGTGTNFRVGYYRDGSIFSSEKPIYSVLAITNNTVVSINGVATTTLNAGQSYLFNTNIGTLVTATNPVVMNTAARVDQPAGCGDGTLDQIPPVEVLGTDYYIVRTQGNSTAEQSTIVATVANTVLTIKKFSTAGVLSSTTTTTLTNAGDFYTIANGDGSNAYSSTEISSTHNVAVYNGSAQSCEVDVSTLAPVSTPCNGSNFIETTQFLNYSGSTLPYFGYVILQSSSAAVTVNGSNLETLIGSTRKQLGSTGWYLIGFNNTQLGNPAILSITSTAKLNVAMIQQGGGFSMSATFSSFLDQPTKPTVALFGNGSCPNIGATLTTSNTYSSYQWYYNGTAISGATSNTYNAYNSGNYYVVSTLACGSSVQSAPVSVSLSPCSDLSITKTVNNSTPLYNSNVTFTVTATNSGYNTEANASVTDLLPAGYTFVSATPSVGTYTSSTGVWAIGSLASNASATITIVATVKLTGSYLNTACVSGSNYDPASGNNCASVTPIPKSAVIDAVNDAGTSVNGYVGGTSLTNVLSNDTLNGVAVTASQVNT
ncbi:hypothetical protein OX284_013810, partial [Flavobacterium sp. SUN046]|nr:hypothetical protein [Flavobacterium sp. SUN046]